MASTIKRDALLLISVFALMSLVSAPASAYMSADPTHKELTTARSATAKYHDVTEAEADGYINIGFYLPGEGYHFVNFGLIDEIIPEPDGGAHWDYNQAAEILKNFLIPVIKELKTMDPDERVSKRIDKFGKMGFWEEV